MVPMDTQSLKHDTIGMELFRQSMQDVEPREQFYFIDACRDVLDVTESKTLTQRLYWDPRDINDKQLATPGGLSSDDRREKGEGTSRPGNIQPRAIDGAERDGTEA